MLLAALLLGGCTGLRQAREVARVTLAQTVSYEQEVDQKAKDEVAYYDQRVTHLKRDGDALIGDSDRALLTRAAQDFQNRVQAAPAAASEALVRDEVDRFLSGLAERQAHYESMLAGFDTNLLNSLESLGLQKAALDRTRKDLEQLQREPGTVDELKRLVEFGAKTRNE
jgi:ABC-type Na+ efflux pump permease subunit